MGIDNAPEILDQGIQNREKIRIAKELRGNLETFTIEAPDWIEAHRELGAKLGDRINEIVETKTAKLDAKALNEELTFAAGIRKFIEARAGENKQVSPRIKEYLDCLQAWGEGANLKEIKGFSVLDVAIWLQNDNVGCQTLLYKGKNGATYILHTEEEPTGPVEKPTGKVDKPRLVTFKVNGAENKKEINSFLYPDLLPGAAFGWQTDGDRVYFQAIDALFLKNPEKPASLANMLAWLALTGGEYDNVENLVKECGPYVDGYAVNMVEFNGKGNKSRAKRVLFAHDISSSRKFNLREDAYSFQGNLIPEEDSDAFKDVEDHNFTQREYYERRLTRMKEILRLTKSLVNKEAMKSSFFEILKRIAAFRVGDGFAMANKDVVAAGVFEFSKSGFKHEVIAGPAMK